MDFELEIGQKICRRRPGGPGEGAHSNVFTLGHGAIQPRSRRVCATARRTESVMREGKITFRERDTQDRNRKREITFREEAA